MTDLRMQESAARVLIRSGSVRGVTIFPVAYQQGRRWAISFKVGVEEFTVSSARKDVRLWARIEAAAKWLEDLGISDASLKLV
jgi:hypothetical protein